MEETRAKLKIFLNLYGVNDIWLWMSCYMFHFSDGHYIEWTVYASYDVMVPYRAMILQLYHIVPRLLLLYQMAPHVASN